MNNRFLPLVSGLVAAAAVAWVSAIPAASQPRSKPYTVSRTPDGLPDLQGFWTNATYTPLERPKEVTKELYLVALAREPSASELSAAVKHLTAAPDRRQAVEDLGWVLINSREFLFRH